MPRRVRLLVKTPWTGELPELGPDDARLVDELRDSLAALEHPEALRVLAELMLEHFDVRIWK